MDPAHPLGEALLAPRDLTRWVEVLDRVEVGAFGGRPLTILGQLARDMAE